MSTTTTQARRYIPVRGSYYGTSDDRADRWYIDDRESTTVDRRGPGYATRRECEEEIRRRAEAARERSGGAR